MKTIFRSKYLALAFAALALVAGAGFAAGAYASAQSTEKLALAKQYVQTVPVEADIRAAVDEMAAKAQPDQRVLFRSLADNSIDYGRLRTAAELNAAEIFSEEEIRAMITFFSSPEGKAVRAKMPQYEAKMQPVIMEVLQTFVQKLQENNVVVPMQ